MTQPSPFPRPRDDLPHAWGLDGPEPQRIWERFSPAYEAQAEAMWHALLDAGLSPSLDWAGSEDGEGIIGSDADGEAVVAWHLEDPREAVRLRRAIAARRLPALIAAALRR